MGPEKPSEMSSQSVETGEIKILKNRIQEWLLELKSELETI